MPFRTRAGIGAFSVSLKIKFLFFCPDFKGVHPFATVAGRAVTQLLQSRGRCLIQTNDVFWLRTEVQGCDLECLSLGCHPLLLCDDFHRPGTWEGLLNPLQQWSLEALKFTHFFFLAMEKKSFGKGECSVSFNSLVLTQFKQQYATVSASLNFSFLPLCFSSPFSVPYSVDINIGPRVV